MPSTKLIRQGSKSYGDGDSWNNWWLFPRLSDDEVKDVMIKYDIDRYYSGPGQTFSNRPSVRHSARYTLITQFGGYDI